MAEQGCASPGDSAVGSGSGIKPWRADIPGSCHSRCKVELFPSFSFTYSGSVIRSCAFACVRPNHGSLKDQQGTEQELSDNMDAKVKMSCTKAC